VFQDLDNAGIPVIELIQYNGRINIDNIIVAFRVDSWLSGNKVVVLSLTDWVCDNKVSTTDPTSGKSATDQGSVDVLNVPCITALVLGVN
jgi:hypothetical protein